eukprot:SAG22_NODE_43_length_25304_cov_5.394644_20_plen_843_part_00
MATLAGFDAQQLAEHGITVVKRVLPADTCAATCAMMDEILGGPAEAVHAGFQPGPWPEQPWQDGGRPVVTTGSYTHSLQHPIRDGRAAACVAPLVPVMAAALRCDDVGTQLKLVHQNFRRTDPSPPPPDGWPEITSDGRLDGRRAGLHIDSAFLPRHYGGGAARNYFITITALAPVVSGGAAFMYAPGSFQAAKQAAAALPEAVQAAVGPGACYGHGYDEIDLPRLLGQGDPDSAMSAARRVAQEVAMDTGDMIILDPMLSHSGSPFRAGVGGDRGRYVLFSLVCTTEAFGTTLAGLPTRNYSAPATKWPPEMERGLPPQLRPLLEWRMETVLKLEDRIESGRSRDHEQGEAGQLEVCSRSRSRSRSRGSHVAGRLGSVLKQLGPAAVTAPAAAAAAAAGAMETQGSDAAAGQQLVVRLEADRAAWRHQLCAEAARLQSEPLFRCDPVLDKEAFRRDGVWVLPGICTEAAAARLTEACKNIQRFSDQWVNKDWLAPPMPAAWAAAGLRAPAHLASPQLRARLTGGTQLGARDGSARPGLFDGSDFNGLQDNRRAPFLQGFCPEAFAVGYDAMFLNAFTHPQMLALQRQMLGGSPDIRLDHCTVMNRKAGYPGGTWHTHAYLEDGLGPTTQNPVLGEVRNLLYPGGFEARDDGGLSVVRGAHLYREHNLNISPPRTTDGDDAGGAWLEVRDSAMDAWLADKPHPVTKRPLVRERLALPPGSLVACLTHAPHAVDRRLAGRGTRWNALLCYANADPEKRLPRRFDRNANRAEPERLLDPAVARVRNGVRRSASIPTTHADSVPVEWSRLAAAGHVPGVAGQHAALFLDDVHESDGPHTGWESIG